MGAAASWGIVNTTKGPLVAAADIEMTAFHDTRRLTLRLDGREVQTLAIEQRRGLTRIGPLTLSPGHHELVFRSTDPATVARDLLNNGDPRPLSFAFGTWHWVLEGPRP
jgi:hypothetical protein